MPRLRGGSGDLFLGALLCPAGPRPGLTALRSQVWSQRRVQRESIRWMPGCHTSRRQGSSVGIPHTCALRQYYAQNSRARLVRQPLEVREGKYAPCLGHGAPDLGTWSTPPRLRKMDTALSPMASRRVHTAAAGARCVSRFQLGVNFDRLCRRSAAWGLTPPPDFSPPWVTRPREYFPVPSTSQRWIGWFRQPSNSRATTVNELSPSFRGMRPAAPLRSGSPARRCKRNRSSWSIRLWETTLDATTRVEGACVGSPCGPGDPPATHTLARAFCIRLRPQ